MFLRCVWLNVRLPLCVFSFPFRSALILLYSNCGVCASGSVSECVIMALLNFFSVPLILFTSNNLLGLTFSWFDRSAEVTAVCGERHHLIYLYPLLLRCQFILPYIPSRRRDFAPCVWTKEGHPHTRKRHVQSLQCHFCSC